MVPPQVLRALVKSAPDGKASLYWSHCASINVAIAQLGASEMPWNALPTTLCGRLFRELATQAAAILDHHEKIKTIATSRWMDVRLGEVMSTTVQRRPAARHPPHGAYARFVRSSTVCVECPVRGMGRLVDARAYYFNLDSTEFPSFGAPSSRAAGRGSSEHKMGGQPNGWLSEACAFLDTCRTRRSPSFPGDQATQTRALDKDHHLSRTARQLIPTGEGPTK
jgi:hypothetical protein